MATSTSLGCVISNLILLILLCFFYENGHALKQRRSSPGSPFHSLHISSITPPTACSPSFARASRGRNGSLRVVKRNGPCHQLNQEHLKQPSLTQILESDQARVRSVQARSAFFKANPKGLLNSEVESLPANVGISFGVLDYVVTIGLGNPTNEFTMIFDTGSDLTWTQCEPCVGSCFKQKGPIYDPANSTTYSNISCSSTQCFEIISATGNLPGCSTSACTYAISYADGSSSIGLLGKEKLTLSPTDVFDGFFFGCGEKNQGLFGEVAGLIGLGRSPLSIVSQTAEKYGRVFSYCLPTASGSNGHLTFGNGAVPSNVKFTPFSSFQSDQFYFLDLQGISIAGTLLDISPSIFQSSGTVIDSGTVLTRLPASAYTVFRDAFKKEMAQFKTAPPFKILDTCFDFTNQTNVTVPKISFIFNGNVTVDLSPFGILVVVSPSQACLAFAGNPDDSDVGIFGNIQQQTLEVVYDAPGGNLGFGAGGCS